MKYLDKEEKETMEGFEKGEWKSVKNLSAKRRLFAKAAKFTAARNKSINIRISEKDFANLKAKSLEEGIPYQALISSVLHKFASGKLTENSL